MRFNWMQIKANHLREMTQANRLTGEADVGCRANVWSGSNWSRFFASCTVLNQRLKPANVRVLVSDVLLQLFNQGDEIVDASQQVFCEVKNCYHNKQLKKLHVIPSQSPWMIGMSPRPGKLLVRKSSLALKYWFKSRLRFFSEPAEKRLKNRY